jgi:hypothetical protein
VDRDAFSVTQTRSAVKPYGAIAITNPVLKSLLVDPKSEGEHRIGMTVWPGNATMNAAKKKTKKKDGLSG